MSNKVVCPISLAAESIMQCHPSCKFRNDDGECLLVLALKKLTEDPQVHA